MDKETPTWLWLLPLVGLVALAILPRERAPAQSGGMKAKTAPCPPTPARPRRAATAYGITPRKLPADCATVGDFRAAGGEIGKRADWKLVAAAYGAREV